MLGASQSPDFDVEYQKKLEEAIHRQNIEQNLAAAYHDHPETFTHVPMLYVSCLVNGKPIQAFVDCGAQVTICKSSCDILFMTVFF